MRLLIAFLLFCCASCVTFETKILSRKIAESAARQRKELIEIADMRFDTGERLSETQQGKSLLRRAESLEATTSGLADILGAPKDVE